MKFLDTGFLKSDEICLTLEKTVEADPERNWLPAYHFAICDLDGVKMGGCDLRIGHNESVYYGGNIGYRVEEPYRGHHYAGKACKLLFELARRHGMEYVIITCDPDNWASRKTCEWLGGELVEIVELPEDNDMRAEDGETHKCIFRFELEPDPGFLKTDEIFLRPIELAEDDPQQRWMPAFHFDICDSSGTRVGGCNLRLGHSEALYYAGNIGYKVDEAYRGHHYAGKACKLLFELAKRRGMEYIIITCNPDNRASRKTCEWLGGELVEIAELPEDNERRRDAGETEKCIYRFYL